MAGKEGHKPAENDNGPPDPSLLLALHKGQDLLHICCTTRIDLQSEGIASAGPDGQVCGRIDPMTDFLQCDENPSLDDLYGECT